MNRALLSVLVTAGACLWAGTIRAVRCVPGTGSDFIEVTDANGNIVNEFGNTQCAAIPETTAEAAPPTFGAVSVSFFSPPYQDTIFLTDGTLPSGRSVLSDSLRFNPVGTPDGTVEVVTLNSDSESPIGTDPCSEQHIHCIPETGGLQDLTDLLQLPLFFIWSYNRT